MDEGPFSRANTFRVSPGFHLFLWNPRGHYVVHIIPQLSLSWGKFTQSTTSYPTSLKSIFILSMPTSSKWSLFRKGFPIRNPYRFFFLPIRATCCTLPILFHLIIQIIPGERYKSWNNVIFSSVLVINSLKICSPVQILRYLITHNPKPKKAMLFIR